MTGTSLRCCGSVSVFFIAFLPYVASSDFLAVSSHRPKLIHGFFDSPDIAPLAGHVEVPFQLFHYPLRLE
jgi:hypothetical protein